MKRDFHVQAPNHLWVADFTYVATWTEFSYVALLLSLWKNLSDVESQLQTGSVELVHILLRL